MTRIGLTQRVEIAEATQERRDCLDQRWAPLLSKCGFVPVPLCNLTTTSLRDYLGALDLSGVILTGGNDLHDAHRPRMIAPERDSFEYELIEECLALKFPIFGVCRGMQVLNRYFGGRVRPIHGHVGTDHIVRSTSSAKYDWAQEFKVNSFHNHGILAEDLADCLEATASGDDGSIEALRHRDGQLCQGIMWHPERPGPSHENDARLLSQMLRVNIQ